jgi:hypothetical protein
LLELVPKHPDLTLDEIVVAMRQHEIAGSRSAVWRFFERHKITLLVAPKVRLRDVLKRRARRQYSHSVHNFSIFDIRPELMLLAGTFARLHQKLIADLAGRYRLPSIGTSASFAKEGGLMDYGPKVDLVAQFRQAATDVDRILNGSKPADLPVQAPTKYELIVNLKIGKALGLTIPETLLATADEVIQ